MNPRKAEILAGLAGAVTFLATLIVAAFPWWLCLLLTGLVYLGCNLALGGLFEEKIQDVMSSTETAVARMEERIGENRKALKALRGLAPSIGNAAIRSKVMELCEMAEKIFVNFEHDREDMKRAHRFIGQFQKLLPIVGNYVHLSSDPDRRAVLSPEDETSIEGTLDALLANLRQAYQAFQENNLMQLRMATGVLKRMIDMDEIAKRRERGSP